MEEIKELKIATDDSGEKVIIADGIKYTPHKLAAKLKNIISFEYMKKMVAEGYTSPEIKEEVNNRIYAYNRGFPAMTSVYRYKDTGERFTVYDVVELTGAAHSSAYHRIRRWLKDESYTDDRLMRLKKTKHDYLRIYLDEKEKPRVDINSIPGPTELEIKYGIV